MQLLCAYGGGKQLAGVSFVLLLCGPRIEVRPSGVAAFIYLLVHLSAQALLGILTNVYLNDIDER